MERGIDWTHHNVAETVSNGLGFELVGSNTSQALTHLHPPTVMARRSFLSSP